MHPGLLVKLRPTTPWRIGPSSGAKDIVDPIYHSDSLYSAVTLAMRDLGFLDEWLAATAAAADPAVCLSSCYPFVEKTLLIVPPKNLWPPVPSARVRWKGARFVPVSLVETLVKDADAKLREDDAWFVDADSECLLHAGRNGKILPPFRVGLRKTAAVDRFSGVAAEPSTVACLEFAPNAGLWFIVAFASEEAGSVWRDRLKSALRLLADSGFGGERSRGWGRAAEPQFQDGRFPDLLISRPDLSQPEVDPLAEPPVEPPPAVETGYWVLSLFSPSESDQVDWSRGAYSLIERSGRVENQGVQKLHSRMVGEGSVLLASTAPKGKAYDVAPEGAAHPVYRAGFALSIPIAWRVVA